MVDATQADIRVLIVDDHPFVREGLRSLLAVTDNIQVVAEAGNADEALQRAQECSPTLVLTDIGMKGTNGLELTRLLVQRFPGIKVLILSMFEKPEFVQQALEAGASGYVVKDSTSAQIVNAIRSVGLGGTYLSPSLAGGLLAPRGADRTLSQREEEVLRCTAKGQSSKQIARMLDISVRTVDAHRQSIKRKLAIDGGQAELVKVAVERFHV